MDLLLDHGADIMARGSESAGLVEVLHGSFSDRQAAFLIERGVEVDAYSAARWAVSDRLEEMLDADPALVHRPFTDRNGAMPLLHFARSPEIAEQILSHGAEIDTRDSKFGGTAAQWGLVEISFRPGLSRYLIDRGSQGDVILYAVLGLVDRLAAELERDLTLLHAKTGRPPLVPAAAPGGHIYTYFLGDATPLVAAAFYGQTEVCAFLLERGAEIDDLDSGATALHWAAGSGRLEVARLLIARGANLAIEDKLHHTTALGWAIHNDRGRAGRLAAVLIERGTLPSRGDEGGRGGCPSINRSRTGLTRVSPLASNRSRNCSSSPH